MKMDRSLTKFLSLVALFAMLFSNDLVLAESTKDLNNQRNYYLNQAQQAQKDAEQKQKQAAALKAEIVKVDRSINQSVSALEATKVEISKNETDIGSLNEQIDRKQKELEAENIKSKNVITNWYMEDEQGLLATLIGAESLNEVTDKYEQYESIQRQIVSTANNIAAIKNDLSKQKNDLEKKRLALNGLKESQIAQQQNLAVQKQLKNNLLNDTQDTIEDLEDQEKNAQQKIKEIDQKIRTLSATRNWGDQIVSSNEGSWYYTQTGNYTKLGNSPYTVDQYGCLITSIAMVATYYGQNVTPSGIATTSGIFSKAGYLLVSSPPGIGITVLPSRSIDWDVVDSEISQNRPVLVSIYLPSVGQINSDGSSHFVVIKGKSDGKYLMHDPISGQRGYSLNQVRSMKLVVDD